MSIDKRVVYILLSLMACAVIFTCTKVSWEDPFTGPNTLAFPIISVNGQNPYRLNVGDNYEELGATAIDTSEDLDGDGVADTTDITHTIDIVDSTISTDSPGEHIVKYYATGLNEVKVKAERIVKVLEIQVDDSIKPVITLNGLNPKILFAGETYTEEGATALDNVDGDLTDSIKMYGDNITYEKPDTFDLWYMVEDKAQNIARKKREVHIREGMQGYPILTLIGKERDSIYVYEPYVDPGATAYDSVDGDLTDEIVVIDSVDNTVSGVYRINYSITNKVGNTTRKTRYIYVFNIDDTLPPVITLLGDIVMNVGAGGAFIDPGATAYDNVDGDISVKVLDTGSVDMQTIGTYTVYYNVADNIGNQAEEKERKVTVIDTIPPTIHVNPPNPVNLLQYNQYVEWGATAHDNLDGDITHKLDTISDSVNTSVEGVYRVHYVVTDDAGYTTDSIRVVNVLGGIDTMAPIITLLGDNPMLLDVGDPYVEPGATAVDNNDGDVTNKIVINSSNVNTSVQGVYKVDYDVSDSAGNDAHEERTVAVGDVTVGDTIVIGTGSTTGQHIPMECYYGYTYSQSIYMRSELNVSGPITIDSMCYYYNGSSSFSDAVRVYMGNTSKTLFQYTTDWVSAGSMTLVYSGNYSVSPSGWRKIKFSTSFTYNNSNNLVIAFDENTGGYHLDSDEFRCSSKSAIRSMFFYSDNVNPNPSSPPTTSDNITTFLNGVSYCPNIKLYYH